MKTSKFMLIMLSFLMVFTISVDAATEYDAYRVRIGVSSKNLFVRCNSDYEILIDGKVVSTSIHSSGEEFYVEKTSNEVILKRKSNSQTIGSGSSIEFRQKGDALKTFEFGETTSYLKFPRNLLVRLDSSRNLIGINILPIEEYLKGVVPHEIGASAPLEAMKAQSVVARSLAIKRKNKFDKDGYDITNTTSDQVYKGYDSKYFDSSNNVSKAVDSTKGEVLTYGGNIIEGLFYSTNGGFTASDGFVWSSGNVSPYYTSKVDTYDKYLHKTQSWNQLSYSVMMTKSQLYSSVIEMSQKNPAYFKEPYCTPSFSGIGENLSLEILEKTNGYVTKARLYDGNKSYILKNYANRWAFGLRSQQFDLSRQATVTVKESSKISEKSEVYVKDGSGKVTLVKADNLKLKSSEGVYSPPADKYVFNGKGYGHGIGMSQNGAMNRAEDGHTYKQIIDFYYNNIVIKKMY